jgi:hypothetical protein
MVSVPFSSSQRLPVVKLPDFPPGAVRRAVVFSPPAAIFGDALT